MPGASFFFFSFYLPMSLIAIAGCVYCAICYLSSSHPHYPDGSIKSSPATWLFLVLCCQFLVDGTLVITIFQ